jgi:retron-type reverse transcriptase
MNLVKSLCESLFVEEKDLRPFASTAPHRYKVYKIKKRNSSKTRTIAHPSKELKFIQRILVSKLELFLEVEDCAFAYREGRSIKDNAEMHLNSSYLLKMDFENFFNSITPELLFSVMKESGLELTFTEKKYLSNLLFWKPVRKGGLLLSVGAPSSPLISNFVMSQFDKALMIKSNEMGITYTRYADDLTFSTKKKDVLFEIPVFVTSLLKDKTKGKIKINKDKTVFSSKAHNRHVTGVTLTNNNKLSLGRDKKRLISSMIHKISHGLLTEDESLHLQGILSHAAYIEPEFYARMKNKYGAKLLEDIKHIKKQSRTYN